MSNPDIDTALRIVCKELVHYGSFDPPIIQNAQPTPDAHTVNILTLFENIAAEDAAVPPAEKRTWIFVNDLFAQVPWSFQLSPSDLTDGSLEIIEDLVEQIVYTAHQ